MSESGLPYLRETLLFLTLAGILIPLLQRLRINQVLGFLAVGTALGPQGLGVWTDRWPWLAWLTWGASSFTGAGPAHWLATGLTLWLVLRLGGRWR